MIEIAKAIITKNGKYLLLKRSPIAPHYPNKWDFPGGKLDSGETPVEAIIREVKEETSFDIESGKQINDIVYKDELFDLHFYYFKPAVVFGELKLSKAHTEFKWLSVEELDGLDLHSSVTEFFK